MLGTAFLPADMGGYAAVVDIPARIQSLSGAGWVTSQQTVDQATRTVPMPKGGEIKGPAATIVAAPESFGRQLQDIEERGAPFQLFRSVCARYFDAPPGDGRCIGKSRFLTEEGATRTLMVLTDAGRGDAHVAVVHKLVESGVTHVYGITRDGALRKAHRNINGTSPVAIDLAEAEQDSSEKGYRSLIDYWSRQPLPVPAG